MGIDFLTTFCLLMAMAVTMTAFILFGGDGSLNYTQMYTFQS